jgi:hypothetical protein
VIAAIGDDRVGDALSARPEHTRLNEGRAASAMTAQAIPE